MDEKINKFKRAIGKIVAEGKSKGLFAYNFSDSFNLSSGDGFNSKFSNKWLIDCFKKTIEDFEKDMKNDEEEFEMTILSVESDLTHASIEHGLGM